MRLEQILITLASVTALAAAARSTWSPCGLSMLSSLTPLSERSRGHRYGTTAAWFIAGAVAGGATLGAACSALALVGTATGLQHHPLPVAFVAGLLALAGAAVDAGMFGNILPVIRRQVDDRWLAQYRSWVYAVGFGWQIGAGLATYVMTCAVVVFIALGAATADPFIAFLLPTAFGAARGTAVLLTRRATHPQALRELHRRLNRAEDPVRWTAVAAQVVAAAVLTAYISPVLTAAVFILIGIAAWALTRSAPARVAGK